MKVVLFCGGYGMRLRDYSDWIPKPLVPVGEKPILWHIMRYYASFGHKDFILCLGWQGELIRRYFAELCQQPSCHAQHTPSSAGDATNGDVSDWKITFVDTGASTNVGQRLLAVEDYLRGEDVFLANYSDCLTDFYLPDLVDFFHERQATATFLCVRPTQSSHQVVTAQDGLVRQMNPMSRSDVWINGGYFVFSRWFLNSLRQGQDLEDQALQEQIQCGHVYAIRHDGFWACMDTFKEKVALDKMYASGQRPWEVARRAWSDAVIDREEAYPTQPHRRAGCMSPSALGASE